MLRAGLCPLRVVLGRGLLFNSRGPGFRFGPLGRGRFSRGRLSLRLGLGFGFRFRAGFTPHLAYGVFEKINLDLLFIGIGHGDEPESRGGGGYYYRRSRRLHPGEHLALDIQHRRLALFNPIIGRDLDRDPVSAGSGHIVFGFRGVKGNGQDILSGARLELVFHGPSRVCTGRYKKDRQEKEPDGEKIISTHGVRLCKYHAILHAYSLASAFVRLR